MNGNGDSSRRILGRVTRAEFVGRTAELGRVISHADAEGDSRGLLLLLAPAAGVSELLRQAYDELFNRRSDVIPIFFSAPRSDATPVSVAIDFLTTFLTQYIAFQRNEPSLCNASLVLSDLAKLAPATDFEWVDALIDTFFRGRFSDNDKALVRFCLSAPQRIPARNGRAYVMLDAIGLAGQENELASEVVSTLDRSAQPYAVAGLRRHLLDAALSECAFDMFEVMRLEKLSDDDTRALLDSAAQRQQVELNEETRDLMVQQFESSPLFSTSLLAAAREKQVALTSFLNCQQLYVDELMGGRLHRHFGNLLEVAAPEPETRRLLVSLLAEATVSDARKSSFEAWRRYLQLEIDELKELLHSLHAQEFINWDGGLIEAGGGPIAWRDYLRVRHRLDIQQEPRALIVADMIAATLKRAPHTMATHYRNSARLQLRSLLASFDSQLVPRILFHFDRFKESYRGASIEETLAGLDAETDLVRLPQVFHTAPGAAFSPLPSQLLADESCIIAHGFEEASYTDANQIVWIVAQIDSKLEAERELTEAWCEQLEALAEDQGFARVRIVLISNEGFTEEACALLERRSAYGVSRLQMELLANRLGVPKAPPATAANEFVTILPMGDENELVAAGIVEQIARRINFETEAINQIKTAIVEACINAAEHSLSPDRKIYQRFRVESDRLVVTISSRGVVPSKQTVGRTKLVAQPKADEFEAAGERRGWGLKLIRSLMDEVEFEQVDDGTSLRMTKYLRHSSS